MSSLDAEQINYILKSAILAPSADNRHPVRFCVVADTIQIRYTEVLPPQGGYKRILALLSLGALVENLHIAASRFGIKAHTTLLPDPSQPGLTIQVHLTLGNILVDPLWKAIPRRHTNRRVRFRGPKLSNIEHDELSTATSACTDCHLVWLDAPIQRKKALHLMRLAETERFRNHILHEELFSAIHFDVGWHSSCAEGLPPGALAVEPPMRPLFALLRHWPIMRVAKLLGVHYLLGLRACYLPCRLAPNLGLLAVRTLDDQSVFNTGRTFQRLWLTITTQGRVLQPMPASALYALEDAAAENIPVTLQRKLAEGWNTPPSSNIPLILFRVGAADTVPIVTKRPQIEFFLDKHWAHLH